MDNTIRIRIAKPEDAEELLKIYAPYVKETAITFEYNVPSESEFKSRISNTLGRFPYLIAVLDDKIMGYAYAGAFQPRKAYEWSVETTVYVDRTVHGRGIGKTLYRSLESALKLMMIQNANACIAAPVVEDETLTNASILFHTHMGYRMVGEFTKCGCKFGKWYNMCWMEKELGVHPVNPADIIPFPEIRETFERTLNR